MTWMTLERKEKAVEGEENPLLEVLIEVAEIVEMWLRCQFLPLLSLNYVQAIVKGGQGRPSTHQTASVKGSQSEITDTALTLYRLADGPSWLLFRADSRKTWGINEETEDWVGWL